MATTKTSGSPLTDGMAAQEYMSLFERGDEAFEVTSTRTLVRQTSAQIEQLRAYYEKYIEDYRSKEVAADKIVREKFLNDLRASLLEKPVCLHSVSRRLRSFSQATEPPSSETIASRYIVKMIERGYAGPSLKSLGTKLERVKEKHKEANILEKEEQRCKNVRKMLEVDWEKVMNKDIGYIIKEMTNLFSSQIIPDLKFRLTFGDEATIALIQEMNAQFRAKMTPQLTAASLTVAGRDELIKDHDESRSSLLSEHMASKEEDLKNAIKQVSDQLREYMPIKDDPASRMAPGLVCGCKEYESSD